MQRLVSAPWHGNVRQLRNLIESMVVLAPGAEIRAADIPLDILDGPGSLLPVRVMNRDQAATGGHELEFILRSLVELKLQVEELRRRLDDQPQRVQVIELGDHTTVHDVLPAGDLDGVAGFANARTVVYRPGMTMAEVEKAAIEAALEEYRGNRRKAAEVLGIGERTLYRKIKAYRLE
jgi:DNA-binding NtrC family response regulator